MARALIWLLYTLNNVVRLPKQQPSYIRRLRRISWSFKKLKSLAKEIKTLGTNKFDMKKQSLSTFYSNNKTEIYKYLTQELSTPPVRKKFNLTGSELLKLLLSVDILIVYSWKSQ